MVDFNTQLAPSCWQEPKYKGNSKAVPDWSTNLQSAHVATVVPGVPSGLGSGFESGGIGAKVGIWLGVTVGDIVGTVVGVIVRAVVGVGVGLVQSIEPYSVGKVNGL